MNKDFDIFRLKSLSEWEKPFTIEDKDYDFTIEDKRGNVFKSNKK